MSENETDLPQKPPVSIWKRLFLLSGAFVLVLLAVGVVNYYWRDSNAKSRLSRMMDEIDASDPNWRLEELEACRVSPADENNSARVALSAHAAMPKGALDYKIMEPFDKLPPPPELLDDERAALLDKEMTSLAAALALARKVADMPQGKHVVVHAENPIATLLPHAQKAREVANLLRFDALNLAQKNQAGESLRSCRAALNVGRSFDDEPFMICHLVRIACVAIAAAATERTLALGEAPLEELARAQALFELEEKHATMVVGLRGERASMHALMSRMANGTISTSDPWLVPTGGPESFEEFLNLLLMRWDGKGMARREHPLLLELMGKLIDNARLPLHEQIANESQLNAEIKSLVSQSILVRLLFPARSKFADACHRKAAQVRCMLTLLAVERHRREHGDWPKALSELTPKLLKAVPLDPYDGKPLRFKRAPEGVIVYSVGPDGKDNGGNINRSNPILAGTDIGWQLWDVSLRRQKPAKVK